MYNNGVRAYRKTNVVTADPKRLVIMCYEGAIESLKVGKERLLQKDYEAKGRAFVRAQDIINELLCSLDFEKGGAIADNLKSLYNYMSQRIIHADINNDLKAVDEVINMLNELLTAWQEVYLKQEPVTQTKPAGYNEGESRQVFGYMSA